MSQQSAKWLLLDTNSVENDGGNLKVKVVGAIERTASGLAIASAGITNDMLAGSIAFAKLTDNANIARLDQAETVGAVWNFGTNLPTVTADPTTANQVTRKSYVDALVNGLSWKDNVRVATTADITLSGEQTIDGVAAVAGDRVLVKAQTLPVENGIYDVVAANVWTRSVDLAAGAVAASIASRIDEGTTNADTLWFCTSDKATAVVGTDDLTFSQLSGVTVTAGDGLALTGSDLSVNVGQGVEISGDAVTLTLDGATLAKAAGGVKIADAGVTSTQLATTIAGSGLAGGAGTALSLGSLTVDWDTSAGTFFLKVKEPTADSHPATKKYVDDNKGDTTNVETFTLTATHISNKYVTLASIPTTAAKTVFIVRGAPGQFYGADFTMDGVNTDRLSWDSLDLDGQLTADDKVTVMYD